MGEGEAALSGGLERLGGDGAAVRIGCIGPGRLCAGCKPCRNLTARYDGTVGMKTSIEASAGAHRQHIFSRADTAC